MSTTRHPHAQLSAYLDGAFGSVDRAAVEGHLDACAECRARLAELRATAGLIRALPDLVPTRRLVPRVATVPAWLAPLRTLSTLASGVSVFLFIASALLANIDFLAQSTSLRAPAGERAAGGAGAPAASGAAERQDATRAVTPTAPSPAAVDAAASATPKAAASSTVFSVTGASPQPPAQAAGDTSAEGASARSAQRNTALGPSPWLWLALAIVTGALALALQRRLRSA